GFYIVSKLMLNLSNKYSRILIPHTSSSIFFFFSSRRRHTRFSRDWSSDVCSSDLFFLEFAGRQHRADDRPNRHAERSDQQGILRSEERRVGKECRSRWSPEQ